MKVMYLFKMFFQFKSDVVEIGIWKKNSDVSNCKWKVQYLQQQTFVCPRCKSTMYQFWKIMIWDEITFIAEFWLELGDLLSTKLLFLKSPISILISTWIFQSLVWYKVLKLKFQVVYMCVEFQSLKCLLFEKNPFRKDQSMRKLQ